VHGRCRGGHVVAANNDVRWRAILLTLLRARRGRVMAIAFGQRLRPTALARRAVAWRPGRVIRLIALAFAFNVDSRFQTALPGCRSFRSTSSRQDRAASWPSCATKHG
jgi:hypothetical protein